MTRSNMESKIGFIEGKIESHKNVLDIHRAQIEELEERIRKNEVSITKVPAVF